MHGTIGDAVTRSPIAMPSTFPPTCTTSPTNSCPITCPGWTNAPWRYVCRSEPQMPHACTFTTTSSGPSSGSGNSSTSILSMPLKMAALTARSSRCWCAAGGQARAQHLLVDLPGGCLREVLDHVPARGHLEWSQPFSAVLFHLAEIHVGSQYEHGMNLFAANLVETADDGSGLDTRVLEQYVLDLARVDVLAAANDHVLLAVDEEVVAVLVDVADVSGVQPSAAKCLGSCLRIAEIAQHDVRAAEADLAELALRDLVVLGVDHRDVLAADRRADGADLPRAPESIQGLATCALGPAVALENP